MVRKPAPLQARVVRSQPFWAAINAGQAWLVGSPNPFMIESPMVSTLSGGGGTCGAASAGEMLGLGVPGAVDETEGLGVARFRTPDVGE